MIRDDFVFGATVIGRFVAFVHTEQSLDDIIESS